MSKIIGTDLGTTSSCMAVTEGGKPAIIANVEGVRTTSLAVVFAKTGERLIGGPVKRQAATSTDKIISPIKRHMDTDYRIDIDGKKYTPQETSAMILQKPEADVESYLGETITETVIVVPAYFNNAQCQATKDAGRTAGLDVKCVANEPTAAALTYEFDSEKEQKIIIYDLGGGTFDTSIIEVGDGVIEILSTNGDTRLGGDGFDNAITNWVISEFRKAEGVDLFNGKMAFQKLKGAVEKVRKELPAATTTNISLPFITATAEGPKYLDMNLTRAKSNELTYSLVERTAIPVWNAFRDADITASELGRVLLVSGSARMIATQEEVKQLTGEEPSKSLDPDEYVAIGVAIQGGKLAGSAGTGGTLLLDVTPLSLSIETTDGVATRLIERNTAIPIKKSQIFSTAVDSQTAVDIHVVQGERQLARDDKTLGQLCLDGTLPAKRGILRVGVTLDTDANGIVNVSTKDLGTGKEQHITIVSGSNMSSDDIDKAVKEATGYEAQDKKCKEAIDVKGDANPMVLQTEKALEEVGDKIALGDETRVEAGSNPLKEAINRAPAEGTTDAQVEDIKAGREKLTNSAQKLFAKAYEQTQVSGVAGQAGPDMGGAGNITGGDDVMDADFKEV